MSKKSKMAAPGLDAGSAKQEKRAQKAARKAHVFGNPIRNLVLTALMSLLLGLAFILQPSLVYSYCGYALGGVIGLIGLLYIIIYFCRRPVIGEYRYEFIIGLVALLIGAYIAFGGYINGTSSIFTSMGVSFSVVIGLIGLVVTVDGLLKLQYTLDVARMRYAKWWVGFIFSILGIALGVVTLLGYVYDLGAVLPIGSVAGVSASAQAFVSGMLILGIAFCLNCLFDIIMMFVVGGCNRSAAREVALFEASSSVAAAREAEMNRYAPPAEPPYAPVPAGDYTLVHDEPAAAPASFDPIPEAPAPEAPAFEMPPEE